MDSVAVIEVWGKQKDSSQKGGATLGADTKQLMAREKSNLVCHYNFSKCKLGTWFTNVNYLVYMCCKCNKWVTLCLIESKIDACKLFDAWIIFMYEIVPIKACLFECCMFWNSYSCICAWRNVPIYPFFNACALYNDYSRSIKGVEEMIFSYFWKMQEY